MVRSGLAQRARAAAGQDPRTGGADRRRVRRQADDLRAARGGRGAEAQRPVRIVFGRSEEFAAANPAPGQLIDLELGAMRDGSLTAIRGRIVGDRGGHGGHGRRGHLDDALRRPVPLGRPRSDRARRVDQPRQPRRLPRARRAAGGVRGRDADGRARRQAATRPDRAAAQERAGGRRQGPRRPGDQGLRRLRVPRGRPRAPALPAARPAPRPRGRRRRARVLAGRAGAGRGDLPARRRRQAHRGHRGGGHERDRERVRGDRGRDVRPARGQRPRLHRRHRQRAATAASPAAARSPTPTGARSSARPRRRARGCWTSPRRSSRSPPRTSRSSTARCARSARPAAASRSPSWPPRRTRSAARTSRSRATAASPRSAARPARPRTSRHVRVDPETGDVTLLAHVVAQDVGKALNPALVEGQMHGGTAQGIGWALLEELAYDEEGQLRGGTFAEYALPEHRPAAADRDADRRGPRAGRPVRRQGRRGAAGVRGPAGDRQRGRRRDRRADARAADDARAGLGATTDRNLKGSGPFNVPLDTETARGRI